MSMLTKWYGVVIIIILYLLPSFIQAEYDINNNIHGFYFGLPVMQSGDEPHYYITLYSLVNDRDFFLTNNYNNAVYRGCPDLGTKKWTVYDRHTRLFDSHERRIINLDFIDDVHLNISVLPKEGSFVKEISGHPMGLPFFAALFLWPFHGTSLLEHLAIYLTLLFSLGGIVCFYKILKFYHRDESTVLVFTSILALGTQYWHYSKTFWAEPYLACFLIFAWYFCMIRKWYFLTGLALSVGFVIKYPFGLVIVPFCVVALFEKGFSKKIRACLLLGFPLASVLGAVLYLNFWLTNNPFQFNQISAVGFVNPVRGLMRWLFDGEFGLLTFSPILLFSVLGVKIFFQKKRFHGRILCAVIIPFLLFWVSYAVTVDGAGGYSARYLIPLIPFLVLLSSFSNGERRYKTVFCVIFAISVIINFCAAFAYPAFIGQPIDVAFTKTVLFVERMFIN